MAKYYYTPRRHMAVDETLVGTRCRSVMRMFIPTKASKFGVKFWCLAESSTGYDVEVVLFLLEKKEDEKRQQ